jgi:hypothetical protein
MEEVIFDRECEPLFESIDYNPRYTDEDRALIEILNEEHYYSGDIVNRYRIHRLRLLKAASKIINLLMSRGGFYIVLHIITFLSVDEFVLIAAATGSVLMEFMNEKSVLARRMKTWLINVHRKISLRPNMSYLSSLSSGYLLRREFEMFKIFDCRDVIVDHFCWLPKTPKLKAEFNPVHQVIAIQTPGNLYVLAYGGEFRKKFGQILYAIHREDPEHIAWFSWNPTGVFLLVATLWAFKRRLEFSICKYYVFYFIFFDIIKNTIFFFFIFSINFVMLHFF